MGQLLIMTSFFILYYYFVASIVSQVFLFIAQGKEVEERFYHTFVMLDHPGADINDKKNLYLLYYFESSEILESDILIDAARKFCYHIDNTRFLSLWSEETPCEFAIALSALYEMTTAEGKYSDDTQAIARRTLQAMNRVKSYRVNQFQSAVEDIGSDNKNKHILNPAIKFFAIILPVTSKGYYSSHMSDVSNLPLFQYFVRSLVDLHRKQSTEEPPLPIHVYMGYDAGDSVYDDPSTLADILEACQFFLPEYQWKAVQLQNLEGKVVHIWNYLTALAAMDGGEYFCLLADDVVVDTPDWVTRVMSVLGKNPLLANFGTVAFFDKQQPGFPSFPCFHRTHLEVVGDLFAAMDPIFLNSFADPWISDVYAAFNSSFIPSTIVLENKIGGNGNPQMPRYQQLRVGMEQYLDAVHRARRIAAQWLNKKLQRIQRPLFPWSPATLAYGREGIFYRAYCERSEGCSYELAAD